MLQLEFLLFLQNSDKIASGACVCEIFCFVLINCGATFCCKLQLHSSATILTSMKVTGNRELSVIYEFQK